LWKTIQSLGITGNERHRLFMAYLKHLENRDIEVERIKEGNSGVVK